MSKELTKSLVGIAPTGKSVDQKNIWVMVFLRNRTNRFGFGDDSRKTYLTSERTRGQSQGNLIPELDS